MDAAEQTHLPITGSGRNPRVRVHLVDRPRDLDAALVEALVREIVRAVWTRLQGPDAEIPVFVTDRALPRDNGYALRGVYQSRPRQIRINLGVLRAECGPSGTVRLLAGTVAHEATHACIHARRLAHGELRPGEVPRLPDGWDYVADEEEMRARREETAVDGALFPGFDLLPRPDPYARAWVPPEEMRRYRCLLAGTVPALLARLVRTRRPLPEDVQRRRRTWIRQVPTLRRLLPQHASTLAEPPSAVPPLPVASHSDGEVQRRLREVARTLYPALPAPLLDLREQRTLARVLAVRRHQCIGAFASAMEMGTEQGLGDADFAIWRDYVREALEEQLRGVVHFHVALYDRPRAVAERERTAAVAELDAWLRREEASRQRHPLCALARDEAVAFFDACEREHGDGSAPEPCAEADRPITARGRRPAAAACARLREEGESFSRLLGEGVTRVVRGLHPPPLAGH